MDPRSHATPRHAHASRGGGEGSREGVRLPDNTNRRFHTQSAAPRHRSMRVHQHGFDVSRGLGDVQYAGRLLISASSTLSYIILLTLRHSTAGNTVQRHFQQISGTKGRRERGGGEERGISDLVRVMPVWWTRACEPGINLCENVCACIHSIQSESVCTLRVCLFMQF